MPTKIHPTYKRLMESAAAAMLVADPKGKVGPAAVARFICRSDATLSNWKTRGVPKTAMLDLADIVGTTAEYLANGGEASRAERVSVIKPTVQAVLRAIESLSLKDQEIVRIELDYKARLAALNDPPPNPLKLPRSA